MNNTPPDLYLYCDGCEKMALLVNLLCLSEEMNKAHEQYYTYKPHFNKSATKIPPRGFMRSMEPVTTVVLETASLTTLLRFNQDPKILTTRIELMFHKFTATVGVPVKGPQINVYRFPGTMLKTLKETCRDVILNNLRPGVTRRQIPLPAVLVNYLRYCESGKGTLQL